MTTLERVQKLLPWVNGDRLTSVEARGVVFGFLYGFEAAGLRLPSDGGLWGAHDATAKELEATLAKLRDVFAVGFWFAREEVPPDGLGHMGWSDIALPLSFPTLRFGATRADRRKQSRREFTPRGAYTLLVDSDELQDLVPFLVMHLLTTGDLLVGRCSAPKFRSWSERCNRLFIWGGGKGRPSNVCPGGQCGSRVKAKSKQERAKRDRRESADFLRATGRKAKRQRPSRKK